MKKTITALSLLSGLVAVLSVILNIQVLFNGNSWFFRFAMFSITRGGGFMGYLGNLMSMLIVALGFGVMCVCGLRAVKGHGMKVIRSGRIHDRDGDNLADMQHFEGNIQFRRYHRAGNARGVYVLPVFRER